MSEVPTAAASSDLDTVGDIAGPYANIYSATRQIGGIIPDVTVREVLSDAYAITNHPVEGGTPISDHYYRQPRVCELSIGFSDCTGGDGYSVQVFQAFRALAATRTPFSIDTGKCSYDSMLLGDVNTVTDPESEYALMMTVRAQEVIITQTSGGTGDNSANPETTAPNANMGAVSLSPVTTPQPTLGGGIGGIPVPNPGAGGIGMA